MADFNDSYMNDSNTLLPCISIPSDGGSYKELRLIIGKILIPSLCIFGVLGNILNIAILTKHYLKRRINSLEKSSYIGLVALAISDLLYCLTIPYERFAPVPFFSKGLLFYHNLYGGMLTNTFVMSSTWLTVGMAVARYFAVCRPLHARGILSVRCILISIILVFIISTSFNIPKLWAQKVFEEPCKDGRTAYLIFPGPLEPSSKVGRVYTILRAVWGNFIPLLILIVCNVGLMANLRKAQKVRRSLSAHEGYHRQSQRHHESMRQDSIRLTLTLIIIMIMFFVLVAPHEIVTFILNTTLETKYEPGFVIPNNLLVLCLVVNFSTNFVLYCAVNRIFRNVVQSWTKYCTPRRCYDARARANRRSFTSAALPKNNDNIPLSEMPVTDGILTETQPLASGSRTHSST